MSTQIALAQINVCVGHFNENLNKIKTLIKCAHQKGHRIIVFPEMAITGYLAQDWLFNPDFMRQAEEALVTIRTFSLSVPEITIVIGCPRHIENQLFNCGVVIRNGEEIACHRKNHLPNSQVFDEKRYFTNSQDTTVFDVDGHRYGLLVCEDIWHTIPAKSAQVAGAQSIIVINASPYYQGKLDRRLQVMRQATTNTNLPILYVNMVGGQDELLFDGLSLAMNANGDVVFLGSQFEEGLFEIEQNNQGFSAITPSFKLTPPIAQVYKALVCGLRDYVHKTGFENVILGLSGGVDSALVLTLAVDALGKDHVKAYMMPSEYTSEMSLIDAQRLANNLRVRLETIPIDRAFQSVIESLAPSFLNTEADTTEENLQARIRGIFLMGLSNKHKSLVINTSNKSELAVGYGTLYGDMVGAYAAIKDVYKTQVYELCHWRNEQALVIPKRILSRAPTAELRPNQTDQDSLPPYDVLDNILFQFIEQHKSFSDIVQSGHNPQTVTRVLQLVQRNEFKRRQAVLGTKITYRAFGSDWRYPISNRFIPPA